MVVEHWEPGSSILLREIWNGRIWTARPVMVVQDTPELIALYILPSTIYKYPNGIDGRPCPHFLPDEWVLIDRVWQGEGALYLSYPGAAYSVNLYWSQPSRELLYWYVNLQEPFRRTSFGFDYLDQELDILISPDLSSWAWKDEDAFEDVKQRGRISAEQAVQIRAEGERVLSTLHKQGSLFTQGWEHWTPPQEWTVPTLPSGWDTITRTD